MLFITKFCEYYIKWKQKIKNLLNDLSNEESKFATKKKVCYRQSNRKQLIQ